MTFRVSQSKVKVWRRCHRAYDFKYVQDLRKKRKSRPLQFGTMVHEALERHCNGDDPQEYFEELRQDVKAMKLFAREREEYGDILEDCEDIITDYVEYWNGDEDVRYVRKKGRGAEHGFEIELFRDVIWNGKIDNLAVFNKLRWLGEHKTYTRRPNDDDRWRNLQGATYIRANDILGWQPLDGLLWDYIKSKPPAVPGILKDGTLSTRKIDTLPAKVHRVIDEHDGDPGNTEAILAMAKKNRSQYFHRVYAPVNRAVTDMVFEDFEHSVREMVDNHGKCSDMNIDKHCSWCDYEPLCRSLLQGLDFDYVKEREYTHGTDYQKTPEDKIHKATEEQVTAFVATKVS